MSLSRIMNWLKITEHSIDENHNDRNEWMQYKLMSSMRFIQCMTSFLGVMGEEVVFTCDAHPLPRYFCLFGHKIGQPSWAACCASWWSANCFNGIGLGCIVPVVPLSETMYVVFTVIIVSWTICSCECYRRWWTNCLARSTCNNAAGRFEPRSQSVTVVKR